MNGHHGRGAPGPNGSADADDSAALQVIVLVRPFFRCHVCFPPASPLPPFPFNPRRLLEGSCKLQLRRLWGNHVTLDRRRGTARRAPAIAGRSQHSASPLGWRTRAATDVADADRPITSPRPFFPSMLCLRQAVFLRGDQRGPCRRLQRRCIICFHEWRHVVSLSNVAPLRHKTASNRRCRLASQTVTQPAVSAPRFQAASPLHAVITPCERSQPRRGCRLG